MRPGPSLKLLKMLHVWYALAMQYLVTGPTLEHGKTLADRIRPGPSFKLWKMLHAWYALAMQYLVTWPNYEQRKTLADRTRPQPSFKPREDAAFMICACHAVPCNMAYLRAWTNFSWKDKTLGKFSILDDVTCMTCACHAGPFIMA
jgi:hypothetical protein